MALCVLIAAGPAGGQTNGRMTTGVRNEAQVPSGATRLERLTPAERLEVLRIAEAERRARRGIALDCSAAQERKPMTDLERASWRLKCRK